MRFPGKLSLVGELNCKPDQRPGDFNVANEKKRSTGVRSPDENRHHMKAIINGKRYDTASATKITSEWNGRSRSDFRHLCEELYKTKNGAYVLACEGGALTQYAESHGNLKGSGEAIIPFTSEEAIQWLEENKKADALEKEFPESVVDA